MQVLIQNKQKTPLNRRRLKALAEKLLRAEGCTDDAEVSVLLTDDETITMLNRDYRDVDAATDVLSFSQAEGEGEFPKGSGEALLGDVVISVETAGRQAEARGVELDDELRLLLAHGLLHLLGYDHAEPEDEKAMFAKQSKYCGIEN